MRTLFRDEDWMQNMVTDREAIAFNPNLGPCCTLTNFRLHLEGTPCNTWNKSAIEVFMVGFFAAHKTYSQQKISVVNMVRMKSRAALESMIRKYRKSKIARTPAQLEALRLQRNRQERKRKVCPPFILSMVLMALISSALRAPEADYQSLYVSPS
jgi:hypothetical protein